MPIDFTQIESGEEFELLCEDLLQAMGFSIDAKVARGPDLGKDIIAIQTVTDRAGFSETHRYLIECKHYAVGGKSVREPDIGDPIRRMATHKCDRYILITSTVPSEKVRAQLAGISHVASHYKATTWSKGDLARLLDEHPDVRERHFPSEASAATTPASALAVTVEGLLAVMGFTCQSREQIDGRVRLVCTSKGPFARPVVVVCKEGVVESGDIQMLIDEVKAQDLGGGVLVTHTRLSPAARVQAAGTKSTVRAFTLDEFYRELIDFEPYVSALIADYENDELSTYYVDLGCQSRDGSIYRPMDDYVDAWLNDPTRNHISILGDYGMGKTSFCRRYAARQGRRWLADPDRERIPILIYLRDYTKTLEIESLITSALVNQYGIHGATFNAFMRYNADRKLLILFDGFDEMALRTDPRTVVDNFWELAQVVVPGSKVVLTCRTPYFRTHHEAEDLLRGQASEYADERRLMQIRQTESADQWIGESVDKRSSALPVLREDFIDLRDRPNFEIVDLEPFTKEDIQAVLRARLPDQWEAYWEQIQRIYNLPDLARRPVLLDMIARIPPELEEEQTVNAARVYQALTAEWLERDVTQGRTLLTPADRRLFAEELAMEMLRTGELELHYSRLSAQVKDHFNLERLEEIDYFETDVRTCNFLNRDETGNYTFAHKSFMEFLAASRLHQLMLEDQATIDGPVHINEEIRRFLTDLFSLHAKVEPVPPYDPPEGFASVPPGEFIMGGRHGLDLQIIKLDEGFLAAKTPVTNAQYARFVAETDRDPLRYWKGPQPPTDLTDHPAVIYNWDDAVAYAQWAGARLPTELEWEKAARGYDGREHPWGEWAEGKCNSREAGIGETTPVGQFSPMGDSMYGLQDAAGNVWEWTVSKWSTGSDRRVLRGGSFYYGRRGGRCATRRRYFPPVADTRSDVVGLRLVVSS